MKSNPDELLLADATNSLFLREIVPAVKERGVWSGEARVRGASGREAPVTHMVIGHRGKDGRIERYSAVMRDISQTVESRRSLQAQTDTLRAVIEAIPRWSRWSGPRAWSRW